MKYKALLIFVLCSFLAFADGEHEDYIQKYKDVAIREMKLYGIPASITLAQGILESGAGKSKLAVKANNHFGIKCHTEWEGKRVYHDDDKKNECFRAYKNPDESFRDHSLFLKNRSRYASLFEESPTDYKAWAKGLKKAGYATNPKYPDLLIGLIERYELHKYDLDGYNAKPHGEEKLIAVALINVSTNGVKYIEVGPNESLESISAKTEVKMKKLLKYNDLSWDATVTKGQRLYTQPKRKKAAREFRYHKVVAGEDMHSISQKFGIRLEYLYKRNNMKVGEQPKEGTTLYLR